MVIFKNASRMFACVLSGLSCAACVALDSKPAQEKAPQRTQAGASSEVILLPPVGPAAAKNQQNAGGGVKDRAQEKTHQAWMQALPTLTQVLDCSKVVSPDHKALRKIAPHFRGEGDWEWKAVPPVPVKLFGLPVARFEYLYGFSGETRTVISYFEPHVTPAAIAKAAKLKPGKGWTYAGRKLPDGWTLAVGREEKTRGRYSLVCDWYVSEGFSE